jgi:DNA ligase-1
MQYKKLAEYYEKVSSTTKRLEKTQITSEFLKELKEKDFIYLLLGEIYPEYDERKIGISEQLVIKAISKSTGNKEEEIVKEWKKIGDLGEVAEKLTRTKKQFTLDSTNISTRKVLDNLRKLPTLEGKGTVEKKIRIITELLTSANSLESKYISRTLLGDLRIGIQESTIRDSLAKAFFNEEETAKEIIQKAIDKTNDWAKVFEVCKEKDLEKLKEINLEVGSPIKVMLAQKVNNLKEGFKTVGIPCAIEYKYDGFRLIIHKDKEEIKLFTRRLENVTKQFPEVVEFVKKYISGESFVIDSEAVGFDKKTKEYTSFQAISQRIRRKYDIKEISEKLPVEINVFDILFYEGKSLLDEPFISRSKFLRKIVNDTPYKIICAKQIITGDIKEAENFYKEALKNNQEGVMMKSLDAEYKPGKRVGQMIKIKPDERDFDLVITGAEYGTGKRSGWMSSFILGCKDKEEYKEIGKVGTGIKEKTELGVSFEELTELLKPLITKEDGKNVRVKPKIVVSVHYQEIQKSPTYSSGYALRFPRITGLRLDRDTFDIATIKDIEEDFKKQFAKFNHE